VVVHPDCCIKAALAGISAVQLVKPWAGSLKQEEARLELTDLCFPDQAS